VLLGHLYKIAFEYYQKGCSSYDEIPDGFSCKDLFPSQTKSPATCIGFKLKMAITKIVVHPILADAAEFVGWIKI